MNVAIGNRLVAHLVKTWQFLANQCWLEDGLRTLETLRTDGQVLTVRKLIGAIIGIA